MRVHVIIVHQQQSGLKGLTVQQVVFLAKAWNKMPTSAGVQFIFQPQSIIRKSLMSKENAGRLPASAAFDNMAVLHAPRSTVIAKDRPAAQIFVIEERDEAVMRRRH